MLVNNIQQMHLTRRGQTRSGTQGGGTHVTGSTCDAQVTDTTTFTDEARRAEVDAWLYDTCTQCLQHMVDLVVQFYPVVQTLLPRILALLDDFTR